MRRSCSAFGLLLLVVPFAWLAACGRDVTGAPTGDSPDASTVDTGSPFEGGAVDAAPQSIEL